MVTWRGLVIAGYFNKVTTEKCSVYRHITHYNNIIMLVSWTKR